MIGGYKDLLNSIAMHQHFKEVAQDEYEYNQKLFSKSGGMAPSINSTAVKDLVRVVEDLRKYENMIYLEDEQLKHLEEQKKLIDECINKSSVTVKVAQLRAMNLTQEQVSELVERSVSTVQRIDRKLRNNINDVLDDVVIL